MLISIVFLLILNPVPSLQDTLKEKNDTTKATEQMVSHNVPKLVTTPLTTKVKKRIHAASSKSTVDQTLSSTLKPGVQKLVPSLQDTLREKKNSTAKSRANTIKPVTTLSNTKMINQTQSTSSKSSSISQTLPSTTKPAGDKKRGPTFLSKLNEKKNSTAKSTTQTSSLNVPKLVTTTLDTKNQTSSKISNTNQTLPSTAKHIVDESTVSEKKNATRKSTSQNNKANVLKTTTLDTKTKNQTQSTSSKSSNVNQHQDPVRKHVDQASEKKNSTVKSQTIKVVTALLKPKRKGQIQTTSLKSKINNQTQSTSSKVNQTLPSSTKPEDKTVQKPVQSVQNPVSEKNNSSNKSTDNRFNVQKPLTTVLKSKKTNQTQSTSFTSIKVNQTLRSPPKSDVDTIQKPVQSVQNTVSEKKFFSNKSTDNHVNVQKPLTTVLKSKINNQTQSTSFTSSKVNQTLPSATKPEVETVQKPVQSVQNPVCEKKNSSKSTVKTINVQKPATTLLKTKIKHQTQSTSTKNSSIDQTPSSSLKPVVDVVQKPVSSLPTTDSEKKNLTSTKSISHNINVNASNPVNTKIKNKTRLATPKPSQVNQTLSPTPKPAEDVQKPKSGENKNSTSKVMNRHNVPKLTTLIHMKNQTHTSSKISVDQTVLSTTKTVADEHTSRNKKISTNKTTSQTISDNVSKPITTINTKKKNQTQSTSSKLSTVNPTLPSATNLDDDVSKHSKKKNTTVQSQFPTNIGNASKTATTSPNIKMKNLTQSTSPKTSKTNPTVTFTAKPVVPVDDVHYPSEDKPVENSPIKIVITEGCVHKDSQTDTRNITKVRETELSLNPGSPLVMTHRINLVQGVCAGDCETQMATLRNRVEFLEKEMSAIKKMCVRCSGEQCPKNCSGQGKCEEGKCVCFQGFSGPDCSGKSWPSNCNKKGNCVKGKCVCQTGYTGLDCSKAVDKKFTVTVETVTVKISTAKTDIKNVKTKPDKTLFVKNDPKKDTKTKPTVKPITNVSTDKVQTNTTKKDPKNIQNVGQVLQNPGGRRHPEHTKGKTEDIKLDLPKTNLNDKSEINNPKDEPINHNVTGKSEKTFNGASKVLETLIKVTKGSSKTKVTTRNAGDPGRETKTNVTSTGNDKKALNGSVTTIQAEKNRHENGTSIDNKPSSRLSVIGSVELHNITSTGFILSWEAPQDTFKNFTVTRRERNEDSGTIQGGTTVENVTDVQRPGSNRTSVKVHTSKLEEASGKKFSQILAGTARSYHFKGLQPQTRYSVSLFGSGVGVRSKIYRLALSTGPEPPTDLMFSNISETSVSVSWTKPKSVVTEFKVMYTNTATDESGSMSVDSQLSHVLLSKLSPGSTYDITVSSVLETLESEPITASVTTVPDPPTELKVVNITDTKALLAWKPSQAKVDSYILSYGTTKSPNVTITVTLSGRTVEHQLRGLHRSSLYMVKITSQVNRLQSSPVSTTFTTGSGVKLQAVSPGEVTFHSAVISWKAPRVPFKSYRLTYQLSEDVKEVILNPSVTHYELTGLAAFSNYTVKVDGERDGQYISFVSAEFTTAQLPHLYPTDCSEVQINGMKESGEAEIYPEGQDGEPVWVYCDMETDGGGWTVFQRRMDGSTDFYRSWRDYSKGFGYLSEEFWLGNDIIHTLTSFAPMSLRIDLRSGNDTAFAHYANFSVSSEANHYTIKLSGYSGTAGDSMKYHNGRPFSTKDKDPDILSIHCAKAYMGGWWYKNCYKANLNGLYASYSDNKGVVWIDWKGKDASLPFTEMKLRPSDFSQTVLTTPTTQG